MTAALDQTALPEVGVEMPRVLICDKLESSGLDVLKAAGLASQDLRAHPHPLFRDHATLRQHIEDEQTIARK